MATVDEILARQAYADGDETWTKDNNYPSYTLYVEPEYVPVTNKRIADFNQKEGLIPRSLLRNKLFQDMEEVIY